MTDTSDTGATPVNDNPATGSAPATGVTPQKQLEEALARIADLEKANRNAVEERDRHRKKLEKAKEDAEREARETTMTETQKLTKRAEDAESLAQQLKQQLISVNVERAALKLGVIDPELASLAIQKSLEFGDDGMPTNVEKALADLVKQRPFLLAAKEEKKEEPQQPSTPAQASTPQQTPTPAIPAMNPGRSHIAPPGSLPPGQKVTLNDVFRRQ